MLNSEFCRSRSMARVRRTDSVQGDLLSQRLLLISSKCGERSVIASRHVILGQPLGDIRVTAGNSRIIPITSDSFTSLAVLSCTFPLRVGKERFVREVFTHLLKILVLKPWPMTLNFKKKMWFCLVGVTESNLWMERPSVNSCCSVYRFMLLQHQNDLLC